MGAEIEVVFRLPGPDEPGFLRRRRDAIRVLSERMSLEALEAVVDFLLPLVKEPIDQDEAREALWNLTAIQFNGIMRDLIGGMTGQVDPKQEGPSESGSGKVAPRRKK